MQKYLDLEDEEIMYRVFNLNWFLPKETQSESIKILSQIPDDKLDMIIPKYGKECWENSVFILQQMDYPRIEKALPKLAWLLQDRNWPGSLQAIEIFKRLDKQISSTYIEKECVDAIKHNDADWLEHLYFACNSIGLNEHDFSNINIYREMKKQAEAL